MEFDNTINKSGLSGHGYVIYEDRTEAMAGVALALASLMHVEREARVRLHVPGEWTELRAWAGRFENVLCSEPVVREVTGWSVKPWLLLEALGLGWRRATWVDSDFLFLASPHQKLDTLPEETLVVAEEPVMQPAQGTRWRAGAWGMEEGLELGCSVNSCLVSVTARHRGILEDWRDCMQTTAFKAAQAMDRAARPVHLWSDQDALGALLGSKKHARQPLLFYKSGRDIVHAGGFMFYSLKERWRTLCGPGPVIAHAIADKPWQVMAQLQTRKTLFWRLLALMQETGPYVRGARRYSHEIPVPAGWLGHRTLAGTVLGATGLNTLAGSGGPLQPLLELARLFQKKRFRKA